MGTKKKFFLVDDDMDDIQLFKEAVSEINDSIILQSAIDGQDAIDKLSSGEVEDPDVIFLDINMPIMNGWQFLAALKGGNYRHIPVIMFSTSPNQQDIDKALGLGALCFFSKPDDYSRLKEILEVVVQNDDAQSILKAIGKFNDVKVRQVFACS